MTISHTFEPGPFCGANGRQCMRSEADKSCLTAGRCLGLSEGPPMYGWPLTTFLGSFEGMLCEEASILSREKFIPCCRPVVALVWHERDKRAYMMCLACAGHNVENRGGRLLVDGTRGGDLLREVARGKDYKRWQDQKRGK